jgi:tRNA(Phe) wybutosine-synthesizing methylase Tyw3
MVCDYKFGSLKKKALFNLNDAKKKGWFDEKFDDVVSFLMKLNNVYTTSCCSGRISIYGVDLNDSKSEHVFLGKYHNVPDFSLVCDVVKINLNKLTRECLYFTVDPLIMHVCCEDLDVAELILNLAYKSGLKRSGIFQLKGKIMIEVMGVDGFRVPLSGFGCSFFDEDYILFLCKMAENKLEKNWNKLDKFYLNLVNNMG